MSDIIDMENARAMKNQLMDAFEAVLDELISSMEAGGPHANLDIQIGATQNDVDGYDVTFEPELQLAIFQRPQT
jgi:hypothetical protein